MKISESFVADCSHKRTHIQHKEIANDEVQNTKIKNLAKNVECDDEEIKANALYNLKVRGTAAYFMQMIK